MASVFQKLLGMGGKQVAKRGSTAAKAVDDISKELVEQGPEVLGKGTSRAAKEVADEIPEAAFKDINPGAATEDMSWMNRMDPRLKKFIGGGAAIGGGGLLLNQLGDNEEPPQGPIVPQEPLKAIEPKKPEDIQKEAKKTVKTEEPTPDGLDSSALSKKLEEGAAEVPVEDNPSDFRKLMEAGIAKKDKTNWESDLLRASENLAGGLSRTSPDYGSSEKLKARAEQYKKDAEDLIGSEQKQQSFDKAKNELNDEKAMRDPNSEISKMVTEISQKVGILKPGQTASAMALKNSGINLGTLLSTIEAAKGRKETARLAQEAKNQNKLDKLDEDQRKFVQGLRKEATTGVLGKQYATYSTGQRMHDALTEFQNDPSGYKDYATLMGGLKALQGDESVVREAEVRLGMSATSLFDSLQNQLQKAASGKMLQPEQRAQMIDTIKTLTDLSRQQYMHSVKPILEQADMEGIDPELILSGSLKGAKGGAPVQQSGDTVKVIAPNGKVKLIPKDQVEAAIQAGGKLAQ